MKTYITYFDEQQIKEYNLKEDENTILFKGNDTTYKGDSINNLNVFYCELCTMYYIWRNKLKSDYVCLKQYRRAFDYEVAKKMPKKGEIITYEPANIRNSMIVQYAVCHGKNRASDVLKVLCDKDGKNSKVVEYWIKSTTMYTNNSMVIGWDDFCKMCEFVFSHLFAIDDYYNLNFDYDKYLKNGQDYVEDGRREYQSHWMAYIGERLVSTYIHLYLKPITIPRLKNNGFYKPYEHKN